MYWEVCSRTGYIPKMANKWTLSCSSIARNVLICDEVIAKDTSISLMFFIYDGGTNKILTLSAKSTQTSNKFWSTHINKTDTDRITSNICDRRVLYVDLNQKVYFFESKETHFYLFVKVSSAPPRTGLGPIRKSDEL